MKKTLFLASLVLLSSNTFSQNSNPTDHQVCVPTTISGEQNATPGEIETYTHNFTEHSGEQFTWTVDGALSIDGVTTDANHHGTVTKLGTSVDIIWDGDSPTGNLNVIPLNPCAQLANANSGLGTILVVNKVLACGEFDEIIGGIDPYPCRENFLYLNGAFPPDVEYEVDDIVWSVNNSDFQLFPERTYSTSNPNSPMDAVRVKPASNSVYSVSTYTVSATITYKQSCSLPNETLTLLVQSQYPPDLYPTNLQTTGATTICEGETRTFTVDGNGYDEYEWQFIGGTVPSIITPSNSLTTVISSPAIQGIKVRGKNNTCYVDNYGCQGCYEWSSTLPLVVNPLPAPITSISHSGSPCLGQTMEFSIEPSISHDPNGYQWSVFFNTQLIGGQSDNQYSAQVPFGYNVVDPIYVDVTAINSCGTTSSTITINPYPGDFQPFMKGINLPIDYCGGRSNTFTQKNPIPGIEYRWEFYKNGNTGNPDETAQGIDMYSFTPDFGQVSGGPVGNGGVGPGDVNSYVIVVKGRGGCGAWSTNSEPVSMVTYNGCNGNGQTPSIGTPGGGNPNGGYQIGLVPNPASDHVNVQIPPGGGNDQANIKIVDSFGMIRKDINTNANSENINISDLEVGIYTVTVIQGSNIDSKQLQVMP